MHKIYGFDHHGHKNPWANAPAWAIELGLIGALTIANQEAIMAVQDDLAAVVAKISVDVDALIARPAADPTAVPASTVQAQVDALTAVDAKITAALPPAV